MANQQRGTYTHPNGYTEPVRIRKATRDYECDNCGARIPQGSMHAVACVAFPWHFCMECVVCDG